MKNLIVLGIPFYDIPELQDQKKTWDLDQETFIKDHILICERPYIWIFGQKVDQWITFNQDLKVRADDLAYIQRTFLEETEKVLGIKLGSLHVMGITVDD